MDFSPETNKRGKNMGRKIWLTALAVFGVSMAVGAAEYVRTTLTLCGGDDDVGVRVVSKSPNLSVGEYLMLPGKTRGRTLPVFCNLDENGEAEMEVTVEFFGNGSFNVGCSAFGEPAPGTEKRPSIWVDCIRLEVNGELQIPAAGITVVPFSKWYRISKNWKQSNSGTYAVKAAFKKASPERAAELVEQAKRAAAKSEK